MTNFLVNILFQSYTLYYLVNEKESTVEDTDCYVLVILIYFQSSTITSTLIFKLVISVTNTIYVHVCFEQLSSFLVSFYIDLVTIYIPINLFDILFYF